jgi:hypothetical protein
MSVYDQLLQEVLAGIAGETQAEGAFVEARKKAREGDPMPLARLQWPNSVWDTFQEELLVRIFDPTIWACATKGSTGCGKGATVGRAICLYYDTFPDAKIILTSVSHEHCLTTLFNEVKIWMNRMMVRPRGLIGATSIKENEEHFILPVNPANETAFAGKHSQGGHTLFGIDEANAVDPDRFDNMNDQANKAILISNPRTARCRFRAFFPEINPDKTQVISSPRGNIFCQTVSALDMTNYKKKCLSKPIAPLGGITIEGRFFEHGEKIPSEFYRKCLPLIPGQRCYDEVQADLAGKDKRRIEWQVHAKFPTSDEEVQVILPDWLERHTAAWTSANDIPPLVFGLDIAASADGDCTCLAVGSHLGVKGIHTTQKADTTETVGWVYKIAKEVYGVDLRRQGLLVGDAIGVGKGPLDTLASEGVEVLQIYSGGRPLFDSDRFGNVRAEMYGLLGDRLNPDGENKTPYPLPPDEKLLEELVAPEKIYDTKGKFKLTPKTESKIDQGSGRKTESIKDKIGRSPDRADAVCLMFLGVQQLEGSQAPTLNRPILCLSPEEMEEAEKKAAQRSRNRTFDPNRFPWENPTSYELAGVSESDLTGPRTPYTL